MIHRAERSQVLHTWFEIPIGLWYPGRSAPRTAPPQSCSFLWSRISGIWLFFGLPTATLHCCLHDAQTGDGGMPEEVQRQEEAQGGLNGKTQCMCFSWSNSYWRRSVLWRNFPSFLQILPPSLLLAPLLPLKCSFCICMCTCTCDLAGFHWQLTWPPFSPPFRLSNQCCAACDSFTQPQRCNI